MIEVRPIGRVLSNITEPLDDVWGNVKSVIEVDGGKFSTDSLSGLDEFSHVQIVFYFHKIDSQHILTGVGHPRNRRDWPSVGVFAQRTKYRPNRIGVSTFRLVSVDGLRVTVCDLDAIDGTPVLDIKPYFAEFGPRGEIRQPSWATELMKAYFGPASR